ncbi:hypothetical protein LCGC14_1848630 [marine sediment metagenome]|uniref:Uncharacterized protein n=1 Tax=marine sediment metagenome TaxID=412755 RepID=A0A0F9IQL3_9ZZZZ
MDDKLFERHLKTLIAEIGSLPESEQTKLKELVKETEIRHKEMKKSFSAIQDSVDFLRLSIKYILFDLEATRRENEYLRKLLDESGE